MGRDHSRHIVVGIVLVARSCAIVSDKARLFSPARYKPLLRQNWHILKTPMFHEKSAEVLTSVAVLRQSAVL